MTKIAIYEKHETKGALAISRYYKNDYVRYNVLKTWVAATVAFWTIVGSYVYMYSDELLANVNSMDYFGVMYSLLNKYVITCVIYFIIAWVIYRLRYEQARTGLVEYNSNLRDLIELEGGPVHHRKQHKKTDGEPKKKGAKRLEQALDNAEVRNDPFASVITIPSARINRAELLRMREQEEKRRREEQILENVRRREARLAEQNAAQLKRQQKFESDKRAIQEKRRQLEQQRMEQLRTETKQRMTRNNLSYSREAEEDKK